jgi:Tfp pilus assembly protein PilN
MKKNLLLGVVVAVLVVGMGVIISSESNRFGESLASLKGLSPRLMAFIALPFMAGLFVTVTYIRKKIEERKWKNALLKTRVRKQKQKEDAKRRLGSE